MEADQPALYSFAIQFQTAGGAAIDLNTIVGDIEFSHKILADIQVKSAVVDLIVGSIDGWGKKIRTEQRKNFS